MTVSVCCRYLLHVDSTSSHEYMDQVQFIDLSTSLSSSTRISVRKVDSPERFNDPTRSSDSRRLLPFTG
jgi:hypothetical protein